MPTVALFYGSVSPVKLAAPDIVTLNQLLADGSLIVPVVEDLTKFTSVVPSQIADLNGIALADCGTDFERLSARVLEGFGLLREKRRLFISYRRVETSGVAAQLYEALDAAGFDVFLDTYGVLRPGERFQDIFGTGSPIQIRADTRLAGISGEPSDRTGAGARQYFEHSDFAAFVARANRRSGSGLQYVLPPGDYRKRATTLCSCLHLALPARCPYGTRTNWDSM